MEKFQHKLFGVAIKEKRGELSIYKAAAQLSGVSANKLADYETGLAYVDLYQVLTICQWLGRSVKEFIS